MQWKDISAPMEGMKYLRRLDNDYLLEISMAKSLWSVIVRRKQHDRTYNLVWCQGLRLSISDGSSDAKLIP